MLENKLQIRNRRWISSSLRKMPVRKESKSVCRTTMFG